MIRITHVMDCIADQSKIRVIAAFDRPVPELLPYLATLLPQAGFSREAEVLTLYKEGRLITVYPHVVTIAKAVDEEDAREILDWLAGLLAEAEEGMASGDLAACPGRAGRPRLFDIYLLLPRTNCRGCGEYTCLAFAVQLFLGERRPRQCPGLLAAEAAPRLNVLEERLGTAAGD